MPHAFFVTAFACGALRHWDLMILSVAGMVATIAHGVWKGWM